MAQDDKDRLLQLLLPQQQPQANLGGQTLPASPNVPAAPQPSVADIMAQALAHVNQSGAGVTSPSGGTAPTNAALNAVQAMQQGATASQALQQGGGTPGYSYMGPQGQTIDIAPRKPGEQQPSGAPGPPTGQPQSFGDILAQLDKGSGSDQAAALIAQRSPTEVASHYQVQRNIANQQALDQQAAEDVRNSAAIAAQRVGQEFPGQNVSMFPQGLSKTITGGRTFKALPSGGYAITGASPAQVAAARALSERNARRYRGSEYGNYYTYGT
jgi:hypothetical protein